MARSPAASSWKLRPSNEPGGRYGAGFDAVAPGSMSPLKRAEWDQALVDIADYVCDVEVESALAFETAHDCLMDSIACGFQALDYPACTRLMGPVVPGATLPGGARVPGTSFELDPALAAFNIGCMNRWLDFNDTWLAAEQGHPSDNFGGILATADYLGRRARAEGGESPTMRDVLTAAIKAYEIQGVLALDNSFNRAGLDHALLVRVASTAVVTRMLGGGRDEVLSAVSNAWIDGAPLRTCRLAPNTSSRKRWAAADATSRAVRLALIAMTGETGCPTALSAKSRGFYDVLGGGSAFRLQRPYGSYVMENVLFKAACPGEFHAQTAVEAGMTLHPAVRDRVDDVANVVIETQEAGLRILDKPGPLDNRADRDHCIRYMVAVPLIFGRLTAADYEDDVAGDPRIDALRDRMEVRENERFTKDHQDPGLRYIGNAVQVFFSDGTGTERIEVNVPIGHRERRDEGVPLLRQKIAGSVAPKLGAPQWEELDSLCADRDRLAATAVDDFMALLVV